MTQNTTPQAQMIQACTALHTAMEEIEKRLRPFFSWQKTWAIECTKLLNSVETLRAPAAMLLKSYRESDLPKLVSTLIQAQFTLQEVDAYIDEACVKIVAYTENCDSLSEVHLRSRIRLRKYIQKDLLQKVQELLNMLPLPHGANGVVVVEEAIDGDDGTANETIILQLLMAKEVAE